MRTEDPTTGILCFLKYEEIFTERWIQATEAFEGLFEAVFPLEKLSRPPGKRFRILENIFITAKLAWSQLTLE